MSEFVVTGAVDLKIIGRDGEYFHISTITIGEPFGVYPEGSEVSVDVVARERLEYFSISAEMLASLAREQADIGAGLANLFAAQMQVVVDRFATRLTLTAAGRVYERLQSLVNADKKILPIPVIAALAVQAQTTRETASRALSNLERRGILKRDNDHWEIIAPRMLGDLIS